MKIAFVVDDLVGEGVQYATAIIARGVLSRGYAVEVVVDKYHDDQVASGKKPFPLPKEINLVHLPSRRVSRNGFALRRYFKQTDAEIIVAESWMWAWCFRWAALGLCKRMRFFHVVHENVFKAPVRHWNRLKDSIKKRFLYSRFSGAMTVNDVSRVNFRARMPAWFKDKIYTVWNAAVDDVFYEKVERHSTHPWLLNKSCPTLVTAGAYSKVKGHLMLMESIRRVNACGRRVRLIVFGRGVLEKEYRKFVAENHLEDAISVAGYADVLPAELKSADGFLFGSFEESFGIALVEALACGCPCISTDAKFGPREILADGKYGRLVPVNDPAAMADAIVDLLDGKIQTAPKEAWERFTLERTLDLYLTAMGLPLYA